MKDFKECYKFPLKADKHSTYIWTADFSMAAMFNSRSISEEGIKGVVAVINGEKSKEEVELIKDRTFEYEGTNNDSTIYYINSKEPFIFIRGWGHLTGIGGLHLKATEAAKIQDELGEYITKKLNGE